MANDPAFLFYPGDASEDTQFMNRLERGCYFDLLKAHKKFPRYTIETIKKVLGRDFESCWPAIEPILITDENGYYIQWVDNSIERRKNYSEKQRERIRNYHKGKQNGTTEPVPSLIHGTTEPVPSLIHGTTEPVPSLIHGTTEPVPSLIHGTTEPVPSLYRASSTVENENNNNIDEDISNGNNNTQKSYHGSTKPLPSLYHGSTKPLPSLYHGSTGVEPYENENEITTTTKKKNKINISSSSSSSNINNIIDGSKKNFFNISSGNQHLQHRLEDCMWNYFNNEIYAQARGLHCIRLNLDPDPAKCEEKLQGWAEAFNRGQVNDGKTTMAMAGAQESWLTYFPNWAKKVIERQGYINPEKLFTSEEVVAGKKNRQNGGKKNAASDRGPEPNKTASPEEWERWFYGTDAK